MYLSSPILPSILNPFALFLIPGIDHSFSVPCPDNHLLSVVVILVVYPLLAFLPSFVSTSLLILHYCSVILSSRLSPKWFLLHMEIHYRWGSNISASLATLGLCFPLYWLIFSFIFFFCFHSFSLPLLFGPFISPVNVKGEALGHDSSSSQSPFTHPKMQSFVIVVGCGIKLLYFLL